MSVSVDVQFNLVSGGKSGLVSGNAPFLGPYKNPHTIFNLIKAHAKGFYQHGVIPNSASTTMSAGIPRG